MSLLKMRVLLIGFSLFAFTLNATESMKTSKSNDKALRIAVSKETSKYYEQIGINRSWKKYAPFINASQRVADMFPSFPSKGRDDRMLRFYTYGAKETFLTRNRAEVNVPGAKYSTGIVRKFSIDYGWSGLNEANVKLAFYTARAIQNRTKIPGNLGRNKAFLELIKDARIPKNINLKVIDLSTARSAKIEYKTLLNKGYNPESIRKHIRVGYREEDQDDIDSLLIYRVIIELERISLGWKYQTWDFELYNHLSDFVDGYNEEINKGS